MRAKAEVLDGLTVALRATEEDDVRAGWSTHGKLVEGDTLASSLLNAGASSSGKAQSADCHLWYLIEAVVVRHSAHNGSDLALVCLAGVLVRGDCYNLRE